MIFVKFKFKFFSFFIIFRRRGICSAACDYLNLFTSNLTCDGSRHKSGSCNLNIYPTSTWSRHFQNEPLTLTPGWREMNEWTIIKWNVAAMVRWEKRGWGCSHQEENIRCDCNENSENLVTTHPQNEEFSEQQVFKQTITDPASDLHFIRNKCFLIKHFMTRPWDHFLDTLPLFCFRNLLQHTMTVTKYLNKQ